MDCEQPFMELDFAIGENRIHRDGELLAASITLVDAFAHGLVRGGLSNQSIMLAVLRLHQAAMRTDRTVRPIEAFEVFTCSIFVLVLWSNDAFCHAQNYGLTRL